MCVHTLEHIQAHHTSLLPSTGLSSLWQAPYQGGWQLRQCIGSIGKHHMQLLYCTKSLYWPWVLCKLVCKLYKFANYTAWGKWWLETKKRGRIGGSRGWTATSERQSVGHEFGQQVMVLYLQSLCQLKYTSLLLTYIHTYTYICMYRDTVVRETS